ncbi:hypothetical protein Fmac_011445 [Flemingia macrophylla]|uniref:Uncharacterized protein n=1 Tax=Flemingia macrophylla TaxID=520843 RepID=A0ABD1MMH6_9FABA
MCKYLNHNRGWSLVKHLRVFSPAFYHGVTHTILKQTQIGLAFCCTVVCYRRQWGALVVTTLLQPLL